jgi:hypothetical protein
MRVNDTNLTGTGALETARAQESQRTDRPSGLAGSAGSGTTDRVEFSNTMGRLSRALAAHSSGSAQRVTELAARYAAGDYRPDAAAAARGLVTEALATGR